MRIRTIKPEFWQNEPLSKCSEFARLLSIALLNIADDEGYFVCNEVLIRGMVFPYEKDTVRIHRGLTELSNIGYLSIGVDDESRKIGKISKFLKHQVINRPVSSKLKQNTQFNEDSVNTHTQLTDDSSQEWKGNGNGKGSGKGKSISYPTLDEVKEYCKFKEYGLFDCERYHKLRTDNNWINGNNKKILNWKNDINTAQSFGSFQRQKTKEELEDEAMHNLAFELGSNL